MFNGIRAINPDHLANLRAAIAAAEAEYAATKADPTKTRAERIAAFDKYKCAKTAHGAAQRVGTPRH